MTQIPDGSPAVPPPVRGRAARFFSPDGRLVQMPAEQVNQLAVMRHIITQFTPDVDYDQASVRQILSRFHSDVQMLQDHLVGDGYLSETAPGTYRRTA